MNDQAEKLRKMALNMRQQIEAEMTRSFKKTRVMVISSGKGGVGKSTLALNMALGLCSLGKKVILLDADLGLANIDIMMGMIPKYNIQHMLQARKSLKDIMVNGPEGLKIIPGGSGINELANLSDTDLKRIIVELGKLDGEFDFMLIDTGAGISKNVVSFILAADDVIIVTTPEPTSLTDAYGLVKTVARNSYHGGLFLVVNQALDGTEGILVGEKFRLVCRKFLDVNIEFLGAIAYDPIVGEGVRQQKPLIQIFPHSVAAKSIVAMTRSFVYTDTPEKLVENKNDGIRKFFKKMVQFMKNTDIGGQNGNHRV